MKRLRLLRAQHIAALCAIPVGWLLIALLRPESALRAYAVPLLPWMIVALTMATASCMRCGRAFFWSFKTGPKPFAVNCSHCGASARARRSPPVDDKVA